MTAPTPSSAPAPAGVKMEDGFSARITFAADTDVSLFQVAVTPPGLDGGDPIQTTTMHNATYETFAPGQLLTLTEAALQAAYNEAVLDAIVALINVKTTITLHFLSGATWCFYGYLRAFKPNGLQKNQMPVADVTIQPTNIDAAGNEAGPVYTAAPTA